MITIAFAFIVHHGTVEWKDLTGGQNGLMGLVPPSIGARVFAEKEMALFAIVLAGASLYVFHRLADERMGQGDGRGARERDRRALDRAQPRDGEDRGLRDLGGVRRAGRCDLCAADDVRCAGLVSILAVDPVPAGRDRRRLRLGCSGRWSARSSRVLLPELLSGLAEYRLLLVGALLLVVLWIAPEGVLGTIAAPLSPHRSARRADRETASLRNFSRATRYGALAVRGIGIAFGGIKAATRRQLHAPRRDASPA